MKYATLHSRWEFDRNYYMLHLAAWKRCPRRLYTGLVGGRKVALCVCGSGGDGDGDGVGVGVGGLRSSSSCSSYFSVL